MNLKRMILSTVAVAAIAGVAGTASAAPRENLRGREHRPGVQEVHNHDTFPQNTPEQENFLRQETARREVQDSERALRSTRRMAAFETERQQYVRDYGTKSAEYDWFFAKWEKRWNDAVARERNLMIEQRIAARTRFQQNRLNIGRYEFLNISEAAITRDLPRQGVTLFPSREDCERRDQPRPIDNRPVARPRVSDNRDYRTNERPQLNVGWNVGVRVHN